jgi:hypothetical protein
MTTDHGSRMIYPRRYARVRPNGQMSKVAKIVRGPRDPVIECTVIDYAPGGACLEISAGTALPGRFELLWAGTKKRCRVVWSKGRRSGVAF